MPAPRFNVQVQDVASREAYIARQISLSTERRPIFFKGREIRIEVIQVPLDLPVYRMANYRTGSLQLRFQTEHEKPRGWFQESQEDNEAQNIQHAFLTDLADEGRGDSIAPITDILRADRRQTEPLLITTRGVVVNGNRRLAAMRELYREDSGAFVSYQSIEVLVMPQSADENDLKRLEVRLQMQRESKLPYHWIDAALALRDLRSRSIEIDEIAELMRMDTDEIRAEMNRLDEAERYLREHLNEPFAYHKLHTDSEQHFKELEKAIRSTRLGPIAKDIARKMGDVILSNASSLPGRIYDYRTAYSPKSTIRVAEQLAARLGIRPSEPAAADPADPFGGGTADPASAYSGLIPALTDRALGIQIAASIAQICNELKETEDGEDLATKPLRLIQKASTTLAQVEIDKAKPTDYSAMLAQLTSLQNAAEKIRKSISGRLKP